MMTLAAPLLALLLLAACESDRSPSGSKDTAPPIEQPPQTGYDCGSATDSQAAFADLADTPIAVDVPGGMRVINPVDGSSVHLAGYSFHSWSPDGSRLAATSGQQVVVFDPALSSTIAVLPADNASWSPDSRHIGYFINPEFHIVDLETQQTSSAAVCPDMTHVPLGGCHDAEWSRFVDWILVRYQVGYTRLSLLSKPDGSEAREHQGGSWSPTGEYLVLDAGNDYDWNFRVLDAWSLSEMRYQAVIVESAPAGFRATWEGVCHLTQYRNRWPYSPARITWDVCEGAVDVRSPPDRGLRRAAWTADGNRVAYFTEPDSTGHEKLVVYDAVTDSSRQLCDVVFDGAEGFTFEIASLAWSADDEFFLMTVTDTTDGIDKLALLSRDGLGMRWLGEAVGEGHWAP